MSKTVRLFENVSLTGGVEVEFENILGGVKFFTTGDVQQVTVKKVSGTDTTLDIQIRYISGNSDLDKLIYLYEDANVDATGFVDSNISGPFSCSAKVLNGVGDIHLALLSADDCVISVRVDFDINNHKGM